MFAACFCAVHPHQLGFANTSLPTQVCRVEAALQLTGAHSYGGRGRVGRNENVTGFEAILRISVAKLVIGFFF